MACKHQFLAYTMKRGNNFDHKKSEQINLIDKVFEYELNVDLVYLTYSYPRNQNFIGKLKNRDRLTLKRVQLFNYQSRNWINQLAIETCVFQAYDVNLNLAQILSPILIRKRIFFQLSSTCALLSRFKWKKSKFEQLKMKGRRYRVLALVLGMYNFGQLLL